MAKFRYNMQNILDLKEKMETQVKTEFANAQMKLQEEKDKLVRIYQEIEAYEDIIRDMGQKSLDVLKMKQCNNAIKIKKIEANNQKSAISKAEKNVDIIRGRLNRVMIERKTHEILKERAFEEFKKELEEQEHKEVDEVISFQYNKLD